MSEKEYALQILDEIRNRDGIGYNDYSDLWDAISEIPVNVVRCKDCKYNNDCDIQFAAQAGDSFSCCYGKRKDGEHE